jgi:hypothetical protein
MCEGSSKGITANFATVLCAAAFALATGIGVSGQGSDGRTESFDSSSRTRTRNRISKTYQRDVQRPKHIDPPPGKLIIAVSEPASSVYLTRTDDLSSGQFPVLTTNSSAAITQILDAGSYDLRIKKEGFFDETRTIDLAPGGRRKINVSMKPQMALLTLQTNLTDAEIEIERAGTFTKPLKRYMLLPGKYRVNVKRRGYASQTVTADLSIAGKEQSIYVVLEPLRIESVLWTANKAIEKGDLATATGLVKDVLLLNPSHAKANFLFGLIELRRGNSDASSYFLKAIDAGGNVELSLKVRFGGKMVDVDVNIDRDAISFANDKQLELNFRIQRSDLEDVQQVNEVDAPHILIKGKSDFYGKLIRPELTLYATANMAGGEIDNLFKFISDYRSRSKP